MGIAFFAPPLYRVAAEDLVLVALGAIRTLQAADEEQGHARRDQDGEGVFVGRKPVNEIMHDSVTRNNILQKL